MQGLVKCDRHQRSGPYGVSRIDEESTDDTCHTISDKVGAQSDQDLVGKARGVALVVYNR